jgi:hypothetical protein
VAVCQYCGGTLREDDARRELTVCRVCAPPPYRCDECGHEQEEWPDTCPECASVLPGMRRLENVKKYAGLSVFIDHFGAEVFTSRMTGWHLGPYRITSGEDEVVARARVSEWTMTAHTKAEGLVDRMLRLLPALFLSIDTVQEQPTYVTHISVPYWARGRFTFEIQRKGERPLRASHGEEIWLYADQIIIRTGDSFRMQALMENPMLSESLLSTFIERSINRFWVIEGERHFEGETDGINYLILAPGGGLGTPVAAQSAHDLLAETLSQLVEIGAASEEAPPLEEGELIS